MTRGNRTEKEWKNLRQQRKIKQRINMVHQDKNR